MYVYSYSESSAAVVWTVWAVGSMTESLQKLNML